MRADGARTRRRGEAHTRGRVIGLAGNLSRDVFPERPTRPGGGPFHGARALRRLQVRSVVLARCTPADRAELFDPLVRLGVTARFVPASETTSFELRYDGERRQMRVLATGEPWAALDLPPAVRWLQLAPLLRGDFPLELLATLARRRRIAFDGQGLVRVRRAGPLELDADFDPELLRHLSVLKLSDQEAEVLGDPAALPVREVVVTHGSRGVSVYAAGRVERVAASPIEGDPTGAGDAFVAAYVASRAAGLDPFAAARRAVPVVAAVLADQ